MKEKIAKNNAIEVDSPEYNKKSKVIFVILMILSISVGGVMGFYGAKFFRVINKGVEFVGNHFEEIFPKIQLYVMPWVILTIFLVCTIIGELWLKKAKRMIQTWDGDDEEHIRVADKYLNKVMIVTSVHSILSMIAYSVATYTIMSVFEKKSGIIMLVLTVAFFFLSTFGTIIQQSKVVNVCKEYAPEKKGSVYDVKFHKVWYTSCDEAERQFIGEASYRTMTVMNVVFPMMLMGAIIIGMFIPLGILCSIMIGILWLIMNCSYMSICMKFENGKK